MKKYLLPVLLTLVLTNVAHAQDLDRLRERASAMWVQRVAGDRAKAGAFVQDKDRAAFLVLGDPGLKAARVSRFEFSEKDPREVLVTVKTHRLLPMVGEINSDLVEPWIWSGNNWFLRIDPIPDSNRPVEVKGPFTSGPPPVKFEVIEEVLDLGEHNQGDKISGSVKFRAPRAEARAIRLSGLPTLRMKEPKWDDANGGTIEFTIDTTTISEDIKGQAIFEAVGQVGADYQLVVTRDAVNLAARIHGRVRVTQSPQILDISKPGQAEISVQNLTAAPFTIQTVESTNPDFLLKSSGPYTVAAGQTLNIPVNYEAHKDPVDVSRIGLGLSPGVFPNNSIVYELLIQQPGTRQP